MKKLTILIISVIILFTISCDKEDSTTTLTPTVPPEPYMDSIIREYTVFKEGSYWVYKSDSALCRRPIGEGSNIYMPYFDSIKTVMFDTLFYNYIDTNKNLFTRPSYWTNIDVYMYLSSLRKERNLFFKNYNYDTTYFQPILRFSTYGPDIYFNSSLDTGMTIKVYNDRFFKEDSNMVFLTNLDEYEVNGMVFKDVKRFEWVCASDYWGHNKRYFYWARNVGLIKFNGRYSFVPNEVTDTCHVADINYDWSIQSYNVSQ